MGQPQAAMKILQAQYSTAPSMVASTGVYGRVRTRFSCGKRGIVRWGAESLLVTGHLLCGF
jgi:hypothetical protein